ncbi:MAG TPA: biotin/lipoyl-containing protein, partial [Capsulimonadaceae bacterium]|nr:biotin/lipoyl-containing protein [Capsulimonadaceae bacterium]
LDAGLSEENITDLTPRLATIHATMVGIFHCTNPALGNGSSVSVGQIVGYIESMKLMNEVTAGEGGVVAEVLIDENLPVEYGQPLFRLTSQSER